MANIIPFETERVESGVGVALSGGGFRATLFHCGSLWRLNELGYLPKLDRISSVSGGSIIAGRLAVCWPQLQFVNEIASNLVTIVVDPLRSFCERHVDVSSIAKGILNPFKRISEVLLQNYDKHLYGECNFQQLLDRPRFVINATNLGTGVSFRFSKPYAGDYRIGLIRNPTFRISQAVTASSAFPPFLSPYVISMDPDKFEKVRGADLYAVEEHRKTLYLTDGGAYDNLGLETVWNRYTTVLTGDAGAPFGTEEAARTAWHSQAYRTLNLAVNQARALRKRVLIADYKQKVRLGTFWGIRTDITDYGLADSLPCRADKIVALATMRTRLNPCSEQEQCELINWGYAVCDAAMRRYVIPFSSSVPQPQWPYPTFSLG